MEIHPGCGFQTACTLARLSHAASAMQVRVLLLLPLMRCLFCAALAVVVEVYMLGHCSCPLFLLLTIVCFVARSDQAPPHTKCIWWSHMLKSTCAWVLFRLAVLQTQLLSASACLLSQSCSSTTWAATTKTSAL
jgi:hypothetical protein